MANLTITVDEAVLRRARARALERRTSVNAVLSEYLAQYAGDGTASQAITAFLDIAASVNAGSGGEGRTWNRDELYDRPNLR